MNCSPSGSLSARAAAKSSLIFSVTSTSWARARTSGSSVVPKSLRTALDARDFHLDAAVQHVLDHHHGVVPFLEGLAVEVLRQPGQVLPVEPGRDGNVLLRGSELYANLAGQQVVELLAHGVLLGQACADVEPSADGPPDPQTEGDPDSRLPVPAPNVKGKARRQDARLAVQAATSGQGPPAGQPAIVTGGSPASAPTLGPIA